MKRTVLLLLSVACCLSMTAQTWIWFPGDMDIWTGNRLCNRRTESGAFYPAYWRNDSHWQTVQFSKTIDLATPEDVAIKAEGQYGIKIDNNYLFGMPTVFGIPQGRHTVRVTVSNLLSPPSLWLRGSTIKSDTTWEVSNYAESHRADTWFGIDGKPTFDSPDKRPSAYRLPTTTVRPLSAQRDGNSFFVEFAREGMGYLQLDGVKGYGQVNIYYGESPVEARDKARCYLSDRILFNTDSIIDLQPMVTSVRKGRDYRLACSRAMRYVTVECTGGVTVDSVSLQSEMKDLPCRGSFICDDTLINHIWNVATYTLHLTDREVMIEGIKRDRWIWSGDAIQSYLMNYYTFMDDPVVRRTIWALRGKDPVQQHINTILDYTFFWFNSIYDYYLYTGDAEFVRQIYPRMQSLMDWVEGRLDSRGMVVGRKGDWVFVDWSKGNISKDGELAFEQMVFLRSLQTMSLCAGIVGNKADAGKYSAQAARLSDMLMPAFWDYNRHLFVHSVVGGEKSREVTRYPNIFAVIYNYADSTQCEDILHNVLLNNSVMPITTPYMRFYELEAFCALGYQGHVLDDMRSYWGGMIKAGATTFWETYDPGESYPQRLAMYGHPYAKSQCHAWGASPVYLLGKYFLGVRPVKPGYEELVCRPCLGGLKWMSGDVPTPKGNIHVEMNRRQIIVEAKGCGNGALILPDGKKVPVEAGKRFVINL